MSSTTPLPVHRLTSPRLPLPFLSLVELTGGLIFRDGPAITGVASLEDAQPGDLSVYADKRYASLLKTTRASVLLVSSPLPELAVGQIIHPEPMLVLGKVLQHLWPAPELPPGIHPSAVVHETAQLGAGVTLGPHVVIEAHARIGDGSRLEAGCFVGHSAQLGPGCQLHPGVKVLHGCRLGARVLVQAGTVIGSDGFGYRWDGQQHQKIPQVGIVDIGDDVEIGANCTLDRATLGATVIGAGCRLDNLVHVGHNVQVGAQTLLIAQVGISGSARIGRNVILAGQVGVADHSVIEDRAVVVAQSGVHGRVAAGEVVAGTPIMPHPVWRKVSASLPYLPELMIQARRGRNAAASSLPGVHSLDTFDFEE